MVFNSTDFIFAFLPLAFVLYVVLCKLRPGAFVIGGLIACSLFYYAWWKIDYLPILLLSLLVNFVLGQLVAPNGQRSDFTRVCFLRAGLVLNLSVLGFFKYMNFFFDTANSVLQTEYAGWGKFALPLGISFFTFQQIAYLVDAYKGLVCEKDFKVYSLYVLFFPHLIAGPLVLHADLIPQLKDETRQKLQFDNVARGLFLFSIGLFKKVVIADHLGPYVGVGFTSPDELGCLDAWLTSLMYALQLYFDFSGYCDMAIGVAEMFNIHLPINFNSPYKARNIQEFWRRWHITLSNFLRDYVYIPLGGSQNAASRTSLNLMITFLLGGLWHGAGWTFLFWGFLHGAAIVVFRMYSLLHFRMPRIAAWFLTFQFVNIAWVFFRAETWGNAVAILRRMYGRKGIVLPEVWKDPLSALEPLGITFGNYVYANEDLMFLVPLVVSGLLVVVFCRNSWQLRERFQPTWTYLAITYLLFLISILDMNKASVFLYYDF